MVTRNGRFRVSKGYSRESVKRDTNRFAEEDFYREQAVRRFELRETTLARPADGERPTPAGPAPRREVQADRFAGQLRVMEARVAEPEPETAQPTAKPPERCERRQPLRRQRLRLRHAPQPGWWARLWRALLGR